MLNWFDIVMLVIMILSTISGERRGFIRGFFGILGVSIGIWLALRYDANMSIYIQGIFSLSPKVSGIVAFTLVFIVVVVLFNLAGLGVRKLVETLYLDWFDALSGAIFGFVLSVVWISLILTLIAVAPIPESWKGGIHNSYIVGVYLKWLPHFVAFVKDVVPSGVEPYLMGWQNLLFTGLMGGSMQ
ncbi:MAG: CvpA family protein [Synergistetes bacterium]|nr:CvpA family protein [Synergistota bacterium]